MKDEDKTKVETIKDLKTLRKKREKSAVNNITKRKQAEEELKDSEEYLKILFDYAPDAYYISDIKGKFIDGNKAAERLIGYKREELIGKSFLKLKLLSLADIPKAAKLLVKNLRGQPTGSDEFVLNRKDNSKVTVEISTYPVKIKGKTLVLGIARDVTERKQAEEAVRSSEEKYRALLTNINDLVMEIDSKGKFTYVSPQIFDMFGYTQEESLGLTALDFVHPDDIEKCMKAMETLDKVKCFEYRSRRKDGHYVHVSTSGRIIPDETGGFKIISVLRDITERKQAEEALLKALAQANEGKRTLDALMEQVPEGITIADAPDVRIRMVSRYGRELTGKSKEILEGITVDKHTQQWAIYCNDGVTPAKNEDLPLTRATQKGELVKDEEWVLGNQFNERIPILCNAGPIRDEEGNITGGVITWRDITEHKQMERELIHSERMAIAGQLAAGVAHEFNNLLSIIGGSAEYAKGIRNENEIKKSLDVIVKSANRGAEVVKKLLTFTKRIELKKESVDLIEVIEEVVGLVKRDLENNSITVVRNYSDIPKTLIDVGQIQQVFLNLIINAKNAMSKGGKLAINVEKEGKFIKIQFHNTGKTINKEDLPRLFTPFFTTSMRQKEGMPGTGLGLAVSYGIIKAHNGVIKAESVKGKGTTFTILLSVTKNENMAEVLPKAVAKAGKNNKRKLKQAEILIVDDEVEIRKLFEKVLDKEGYSVTVADNGGNALNLCRKKKFDLIYLDIIMPGMDGISVFKKIKEISPKTKIVFFTGKLIEDKVAGICLDEGAVGFLRKPIPLKVLVSYTQNILKDKNE